MPRSGSESARRRSASTSSALELAELVDLAAREQRRVHLEVGVLGRRADQGDEALLDRRQERVLLRLVEAVDLVEEEDGAPARRAALARPLDHRRDLGLAGVDRRLLLEGRVGGCGDDPRERRLARARRAVEDRRVRLARSRPRCEAPSRRRGDALARQLVQRARAHPDGKGRLGRRNAARGVASVGLDEEAAFHADEYAPGQQLI